MPHGGARLSYSLGSWDPGGAQTHDCQSTSLRPQPQNRTRGHNALVASPTRQVIHRTQCYLPFIMVPSQAERPASTQQERGLREGWLLIYIPKETQPTEQHSLGTREEAGPSLQSR